MFTVFHRQIPNFSGRSAQNRESLWRSRIVRPGLIERLSLTRDLPADARADAAHAILQSKKAIPAAVP
jgi:hypothetical protein